MTRLLPGLVVFNGFIPGLVVFTGFIPGLVVLPVFMPGLVVLPVFMPGLVVLYPDWWFLPGLVVLYPDGGFYRIWWFYTRIGVFTGFGVFGPINSGCFRQNSGFWCFPTKRWF